MTEFITSYAHIIDPNFFMMLGSGKIEIEKKNFAVAFVTSFVKYFLSK